MRTGKQLLYFVRVENGGPIKVGITQNVDTRLLQLQAWCPYKLEPIFAFLAPKIAETYCLEVLKPHRLRGEWHHPHPFVLNFIDELRADGEVRGCPESSPWAGGPGKAVRIRYDYCVPRIWPDREAMRAAADLRVLQPFDRYIADPAICRLVLDARKRGFNLATSDIVEVIEHTRVDRPYRSHGPRKKREAKKRQANEFLILKPEREVAA